MTRRERELDDVIEGRSRTNDEDTQALAVTAEDLRSSLAKDAPGFRDVRAMFIEGAAARRGKALWPRIVAPALAMTMLIGGFIYLAARQALPGDTFWGARERFFSEVGLTKSGAEEARIDIVRAKRLLDRAEVATVVDPPVARALAFEAIAALEEARQLLEATGLEGVTISRALAQLEDRAAAIVAGTTIPTPSPSSEGDDGNHGLGGGGSGDSNSGPGGGSDDEPGDDSSGPGSGGGSGDSNGGPGEGSDDEPGDDQAGPGNGDDSGNSGTGSDDSGSDDSGSDDSGSDDSGSDDSGSDDFGSDDFGSDDSGSDD